MVYDGGACLISEAAAQALRDVLQSIKNRPIIGPKSS